MAVQKIYCDKTEIVCLFLQGKKLKNLNLDYNAVQRIHLEKIQERKLFSKVDSEKITIFTNKQPDPIVYTYLKEKKYWDGYKKGLEKFAKHNRIPFEVR